MSMWLSIVRVTPESFKEIKRSPDLLDPIFFDEDQATLNRLGIEASHSCGIDYLSLSGAYEAMAEATGEEVGDDIIEEDLGPIKELDYDAGYGPAFYLDPEQVKTVRETSMIPDMDDEAAVVFDEAVETGAYLVGVVS